MRKRILFCFGIVALMMTLFFNSTVHAKTSSNAAHVPKVYAYWAGWSDQAIPNFKFDGLFLSFAMLHADGQGSYYTDYSLSGNFQLYSDKGAYSIWNKWLVTHWPSGSRAHVSYGGGTNAELRGLIINASDQQLDQLAGEIKANIAKYYFDGVDLDIEAWWIHSRADNEKFSTQLASMVKKLRRSLDNDPSTYQKPIMLTVGVTAANAESTHDSYAGSMRSFFSDVEAMSAVSDINIMSYNTGVPHFYTRLDLISDYLNAFKAAGVPAQKLITGVQICETAGATHTPPEVITNLGQFIKQENYGGLFLWAIGSGQCGQDPATYIKSMQTGLGVN